MWTLIKGAFWFSLVLVMLPVFDRSTPEKPAASGVEIGQAVSAASEALSYMSAICAEKPDVCVQGAKTFEALGHRAKDGARIAYSFLDTKFGDADKRTDKDKAAIAKAGETADAKADTATDATIVTGALPDGRIPVPKPRPDR